MSTLDLTIDGNEAAALIAHKLNEVIAIYPITPASPMGELCDVWSSQKRPNLWGDVPRVVEMQSEAGAAGAVHGALQTGSLTTTFTASQGLLLMIPNLYKIAGELTPAVIHVAARTVATSGLSIFGDHSDVMAARATGFGMLASASVQEVLDFALVSHAASLEGRLPVLHFFDGFRTSHEVAKIRGIDDEHIRAMIDEDAIRAHRARALSPDHPVLRGSAMNPDVAFQAREAVEPFYRKFPEIIRDKFRQLAELTGRSYDLFDYEGAEDAERVIVLMGSGAETAGEACAALVGRGERVGVLKVRLFRPFAIDSFVEALPSTVKSIAVLDRTKEPGASGEPLYQDVLTAVQECWLAGKAPFAEPPRIVGGRYGLSSKEFTPAMVKTIFDELEKPSPKNHFTVGIVDDLCETSLEISGDFDVREKGAASTGETYEAVFFGLGSDGTVSANKNSIKIIGGKTDSHVQGYFVYDSKKAGSVTVSHLRVSSDPIRSTYLIDQAQFVACHQFHFLEKLDVVERAAPGGVLLLNSPHAPDKVWSHLPRDVQEQVISKGLRLFVIDAYKIAREVGLGRRINTIMQVCFFSIADIIPPEIAIDEIKGAIEKTYGKKGREIVTRNFAAVDHTLEGLHEIAVPATADSTIGRLPPVTPDAPEFVQDFTACLIAGHGDQLPVSKIPCDGTFPTGTARFEKRNLAEEIPIWDESVCIQCNKCAFVCPHTAIRAKAYEPSCVDGAPESFKSCEGRGRELDGLRYTLQVAPEDCTGCGICVHVCPAKNKSDTSRKAINMAPQAPAREREAANFEYFLGIPEADRREVKADSVRGSQFLEPLFDASGACAGCGETPYVKLLTQLFGDRLLVANATGCSSIYGGNLPTTPWSKNADGRGPAWSNSLFEDNAEFGLGFRISVEQQRELAERMLREKREELGAELVDATLAAPQTDEAEIYEQRQRLAQIREKLEKGPDDSSAKELLSVLDAMVERSVWTVGGDGWAYDIGFGGLDHVLASGENVNVLVLDTEVYSNTGGQTSKSTPRAAVAKFSAAGKETAKKDLGLIAMSYGNVYVARVAFGANDAQTVRAFIEAERHPGPSLILAYSHCIAHGIHMGRGTDQQKLAVECGQWPLYRYQPALALEGKNPFKLDSRAPKRKFAEYAYTEARFRMLEKSHPEESKKLLAAAQRDLDERWRLYEQLAGLESGGIAPVTPPGNGEGATQQATVQTAE